MLLIKFFIILLSLTIIKTFAVVRRNFDIQFNNLECDTYNKHIVSHFDCEMGHLLSSPKQTTLNLNFTYVRPTEQQITVLIEALRPGSKNGTKFIEASFELCKFFNGGLNGKLFNIFYKLWEKHSNLMMKCPFRKDFVYIIKDLYFNASDFPTYAPEASLKTEIKSSVEKDLLWILKFSTDIVYKRKIWR